MCPYPAQVDRATIIDTARQIIEQQGLAALSLGKLAKALGVKAPSLYHHIHNKQALLRAINSLTLRGLLNAMNTALPAGESEPETALLLAANAYRAYAHAHPVSYDLLFSGGDPELRPAEDERLAVALPFQDLIAQIAGPHNALPALRGLWALLHGFVALELADQFQRPGSRDESWEKTLRAYLAGWTRSE